MFTFWASLADDVIKTRVLVRHDADLNEWMITAQWRTYVRSHIQGLNL